MNQASDSPEQPHPQETSAAPSPPLPPEIETGRRVIMETLGRDLEARGSANARAFLPKQVRLKHERTGPSGALRVVSFNIFSRFSTYSASYNARNAQQNSMLLQAWIKGAGNELAQDEAVAIATKALNPPPQAVLETAQYDEAGGEPFFLVRWRHVHENVPVERDFIQVLINGQSRRIFAWHRKWHEINQQATER